MIPLMFLLGQQSTGAPVTPPGTVPSTCVSGCTTPLPEIRNSSGDIVNIGDFWTEQGGYYSGLFTLTGNEIYALIISPASFGQINNVWHGTSTSMYGTLNYFASNINGKKNTDDAINWVYANNQQNNYPLMKMVKEKRDLNYSGFSDWYIPSRDETILLMKYYKPNNECTRFNSTSCTGRVSNTTNLFPCNICNLSDLVQTNFYNFIETQTESLQPVAFSSGFTIHFITSSRLNTSSTGHNYFVFNYLTTYANYMSNGYGNYSGSTSYGSARLVRRVLVS